MILALSIRDFVLIDRLDIEPGNGFTALTGETGAGKSIILDALALTLGAAADRAFVRAGAAQASVAAEFAAVPGHPVWEVLAEHGFEAGPDETLTLKRIVRASGPARAFINDQPVSAALLAEAGETLVEIHGQHAASALLRPSAHRKMLDLFAGNEALLDACAAAHAARVEARETRERLEAETEEALRTREWLAGAVEELDTLAPQAGEAGSLTETRTRLMQSERVTEAITEAEEALADAEIETALSKASRAAERICRLPGFDGADHPMAHAARSAAEALERALIETGEAEAAIAALESLVEHDTSALESAEARLFALRAVARKHMVDPDMLPDVLETLQERLNLVEAGEDALIRARKAESVANAAWHDAAEKLTAARTAAAAQLEKAIAKELAPLKLGRAVIRVSVAPLGEDGGAHGADRVEFDAETNPGAGFGPLRKIASGGELARVSLALKCALAEAGSAGTLIFDEADQGVGGAVAAAIGERLIRLGRTRQVFAITHSPQVAAAARSQWLVEKGRSKSGGTRLRGLDESDRQEEIARMLSGAEITEEARAAAGRLLEDA
ncbi:putative DNA repair protein RecN [Hyphomonas adhaerens MHS-3]|uniref:DNA repair protein RecN n=2 Tax=Hyphomonas adhaerens TaxID=81029 RepID=A0A069E4X6_9PROT|nr:DNA repair protein RecN [Hyphomonas adhaerens]KCZ85320.1 putative DNA repair protein RecN [Hyphomonas adhaerens MHS-3]